MRAFVISLGHCNPSVWAISAARFYETAGLTPVDGGKRWLLNANGSAHEFEHIWLDQHYPLGDRKDAHAVCERYGIRVLDAGRNLGLHGGFNHVLKEVGARAGDMLVGFDPDSYPDTPGWLQAMVEVMQNGEKVAWISLMNRISRGEMQQRGFRPEAIGRHVVWETLAPVVNSICAWSGDFLLKTEGLHEPLEFYGFLECAMWPRLKAQGKQWVFIDGVWEGSELVGAGDEEYRQWKAVYAHEKRTSLSFAEWLKTGKPLA